MTSSLSCSQINTSLTLTSYFWLHSFVFSFLGWPRVVRRRWEHSYAGPRHRRRLLSHHSTADHRKCRTWRKCKFKQPRKLSIHCNYSTTKSERHRQSSPGLTGCHLGGIDWESALFDPLLIISFHFLPIFCFPFSLTYTRHKCFTWPTAVFDDEVTSRMVDRTMMEKKASMTWLAWGKHLLSKHSHSARCMCVSSRRVVSSVIFFFLMTAGR